MLIAVDGPDGAGKSTHVALLRDWLLERGTSCEVVSKWDALDPERLPEHRFLRGTTREELRVCVAEMPTPARSMFILWMYAATAARAVHLSASRLVLLDGFWMKHAAAELAYGADRRVVEAMVAAMPAVDAVFYLDVEPAEALRRKGDALTPYECGLDRRLDGSKFLWLQEQIRTTLLGWAHRDGWQIVPAGPVDRAQADLRDRVRAALAGNLVTADE